MRDLLTFRLTKLDGKLNRQVTGYRIDSPIAPFAAIVPFDQPIQTRGGNWVSGNAARYHYWPDRWHNILTLYSTDRTCRGLYCDIVTPAQREANLVWSVDLDLDLWVAPELNFRVLDEDEFLANAETFAYSEHLVSGAKDGLAELVADLETRQGLFLNNDLFEISDAEWALMTAPVIVVD